MEKGNTTEMTPCLLLLLGRVETILRDAERWSRDAIATEPVAGLDAERRRLAQD